MHVSYPEIIRADLKIKVDAGAAHINTSSHLLPVHPHAPVNII